MYEVKCCRGVICHDNKEWCKLWKGIDCLFKIAWDIWRIVTQALKRLKSLHFNGLLLNKVYNVGAKKVPKSHFSWHSRRMRNLKKTDLWFGKSHEEFTKFLPEHLRVSKLGLWWDLFIQILKCMIMCFTTIKNNTNFEEELTCRFKIDMRNFYKFWPGHSKVSKICTSMDSFWAKYIISELKKYRGFMFHHIEDWCKFEEKLTCGLENDIEEFGKFLPGHLNVSKLGLWWNTVIQSKKLLSLKFTEELCIIAMKNVTKFEEKLTCCFKIDTTIWPILTPEFEGLKNLLFNWLLLTKVYNIWAKKHRRIWWHWKFMQNWKENWL